VRSPALAHEVGGQVARIAPKIGKADVLDTDPAAKADARVVEVEIRLDAGHGAEALTDLQVEVEIETGGAE
jgi:HlyD family secretion protein